MSALRMSQSVRQRSYCKTSCLLQGHPRVTWALAVALSGALLAAAQPPIDLWVVSPLALVPWLCAARSAGLPCAFVGGFAVGAAYGLLVSFWIPSALTSLGASTSAGVTGLLLVVSWGKGLPFALLGGVLYGMRSWPGPARLVVLCVFAFALDWLASAWHWGLPFALLGHSQRGLPGVAQLAAVGGVPLLSAFLVGVNYAIGEAIGDPRNATARRLAASLVAAWIGTALLGLPVAEAVRARPESGRSAQLLVIQPNLPRGERWAPELQRVHLKRTADFTERALRSLETAPDAVVWPENLLTTPIEAAPELAAELQARVDAIGVPVITGLVRGARGSDPNRYRSSVVWWSPGTGPTASMDKVLAVPVVESGTDSPGARLVKVAFGGASRSKRVEVAGASSALRGEFSVAPILCYEALFPGVADRRRERDSLALLNLADDSWAPRDTATRQLTAYGAFRAIEQRLSLVRVAHGGLSVTVDEYGRTQATLPLDAYGYLLTEVSRSEPPSWRERAALLAVPILTGIFAWAALGRIRFATRTPAPTAA